MHKIMNLLCWGFFLPSIVRQHLLPLEYYYSKVSPLCLPVCMQAADSKLVFPSSTGLFERVYKPELACLLLEKQFVPSYIYFSSPVRLIFAQSRAVSTKYTCSFSLAASLLNLFKGSYRIKPTEIK